MTDLLEGTEATSSLASLLKQEGTNIPLKDTPKSREILQKVNSTFDVAKNNRLQFERQWYLNIAFYFGKQYVQWSSTAALTTSRLFEPVAPPWRVRLTVNKVRQYVRKEFAKATKESPTGFVIPASTDDEDRLAARAGEAIIEHLWREGKYDAEFRRAVFWAVLIGNGFQKDYYNKIEPSEKDHPKDAPAIESVTPFHIWVPDPTQPDIEKQEAVIHGMQKNVSWVKKTYGKDLAPNGTYSQAMMEEKFLQAMGITERETKNTVYIKEGWFKPGGVFENGALVVWAGDEILYYDDSYPYDHMEYPFSKIDNIPTGRFYNESSVTDLIPIQKEYNKTRSQIIEAKNRMSKPQLAAPKGSIDTNKVTSEPGLIIEYRPGFQPPTPIPLQGLPGYVVEELDRNIKDMDDISGQHEVSRGQAPTGVEAATAISYLQEQDDTVISPLIISIEEAAQKVGQHSLYYVNRKWDLERQIRVVGYANEFEAFEFSKANLNGNTDFIVQTGSATPRSQAAKQAFIMNAIKDGLIPAQMGLKYLEMSEAGKLFDELQIDTKQAQRENLKMAMIPPQMLQPEMPELGMGMDQGLENAPQVDPSSPVGESSAPQPPPLVVEVNTWDNHVAHIMEHDNYRKRQEYESLDPVIQQQFELHVQKHKLTLASQYGLIPSTDEAALLDSVAFRIINGIPLTPGVTQDGSTQKPQPRQQG